MSENRYNFSDFVPFDAPTGRTTPLVTFDVTGKIYLSAAATKAWIKPKRYAATRLYYNAQDNVVALKMLAGKEQGAIELKDGAGGGLFLNSRAFATTYGMMEKKNDAFVLKDEYVGKYFIEQATIEGLGDVFIIKLNEKKI